MNEQIKCPVCGKVGIPDYHKEEVVCPCCGTNLSIYKMLSDSQEQPTPNNLNSKIWKIATAASAAIAIVAIYSSQDTLGNSEASSELKKEYSQLRDSANMLVSKLGAANKDIENLKKQIENTASYENIYIVKKNDSPCKISRNLYGTESRYKEIEAIITKPLQPGDTLKIK